MPIKNGDEVAGAPLLAGVKVLGSGSGKAMTGGVVSLAFGKARPSPVAPREIVILAITEADLLLLSFQHGAIHPKATGVLSRIPRSEVVGASLPRALTMNDLRIVFTDGTEWHFDVTKPGVKVARSIAEQLGPIPETPPA